MNGLDLKNSLIKQPLLIAIGFFIATLVIAVLLLWPKFQEFQITQKRIEEKKEAIQAKEEYLLKLAQTKEILSNYREELVKIDSSLPNHPSLPYLFNYIQETAVGFGLILTDLTSFNTAASKELPQLKETVFGVELTGSYLSFKNFLSFLEKSVRLISLEKVSFSQPEEGSAFDFKLEVKTHSY